MKTQSTTLRTLFTLGLALSLGISSYGQTELLALSIYKTNELSPTTSLNLAIPVEEGKTFFRLNMDASKIEKFQDDTGFDFLKTEKGLLTESTYASFDSYNSRVDLGVKFEGTPAKGAREASLQGTFILEFEQDGAEEVTTKLKMPGDNSSIVSDTNAGSFEVWNDGEATTDTDTYTIYRIASSLPVKSVTVLGGDDTEEAKTLGLGLNADQFVFKTEPEEVEVKISIGKIEQVEVPIDLTFGIGF